METNRFSFFKSPIQNTHPYSEVTLVDIYNYIKGDSAAQNTQNLRKITDKKQAQKFKCYNFDYCTFSGVFSERKENTLSNTQIFSALTLMGCIRMNVIRHGTNKTQCPLNYSDTSCCKTNTLKQCYSFVVRPATA